MENKLPNNVLSMVGNALSCMISFVCVPCSCLLLDGGYGLNCLSFEEFLKVKILCGLATPWEEFKKFSLFRLMKWRLYCKCSDYAAILCRMAVHSTWSRLELDWPELLSLVAACNSRDLSIKWAAEREHFSIADADEPSYYSLAQDNSFWTPFLLRSMS